MKKEEIGSFCPGSVAEWRAWLAENHLSQNAVWLILYKKSAGDAHISWSDAVDQALCFGWIDSVRYTIDSEKFRQYFCKRKVAGTWSKINKDKVAALVDSGLMAPAGLESIRKAKQNGSWTILDSVEAGIVPPDLQQALTAFPDALEFFEGLSKSVRKMMLYWVASAKRPETRQKRIEEIASHAGEKRKPKQF